MGSHPIRSLLTLRFLGIPSIFTVVVFLTAASLRAELRVAYSSIAMVSGPLWLTKDAGVFKPRETSSWVGTLGMMTILVDGFKEGTHDLQKGMCSTYRFQLAKRENRPGEYYPRQIDEIPNHGCYENLSRCCTLWNHSRRHSKPVRLEPIHEDRRGYRSHGTHSGASKGR